VLNNADIVKLLRTRFVAMAIDNVQHLNMTAAEKEFLGDRGLKFCTQGMSVFTAGGKVLGMGGGFEPDDVKRLLVKALEDYRPEEPPVMVPPRDEKDPALRKPPADGLVLYVTWKVLGGYDRSQSPLKLNERYDKHIQDSVGVDRLWVRKDEAEALAAGTFPESLRKRILWHVSYTMAGGKGGKLKTFDLALRDGRLTGSFQTDADDPGHLMGFVETRDSKVTKFDLVVKGLGGWAEDCGFSAGLRMVPKGKKAPVALLFSLADPQDDLARVPPHRANHNGYLE